MTIQYDPQKVTDWLTPLEKVYARQSQQLDRYHEQLRERDRQEREARIDIPEVLGKLANFSQTVSSVMEARQARKLKQDDQNLKLSKAKWLDTIKDTDKPEAIKLIKWKTDESNLKKDYSEFRNKVNEAVKFNRLSPEAGKLLLDEHGANIVYYQQILAQQKIDNGIEVVNKGFEGNEDLQEDWRKFGETNDTQGKKGFIERYLFDQLTELNLSDELIAEKFIDQITTFSNTKGVLSKVKIKNHLLSSANQNFATRLNLRRQQGGGLAQEVSWQIKESSKDNTYSNLFGQAVSGELKDHELADIRSGYIEHPAGDIVVTEKNKDQYPGFEVGAKLGKGELLYSADKWQVLESQILSYNMEVYEASLAANKTALKNGFVNYKQGNITEDQKDEILGAYINNGGKTSDSEYKAFENVKRHDPAMAQIESERIEEINTTGRPGQYEDEVENMSQIDFEKWKKDKELYEANREQNGFDKKTSDTFATNLLKADLGFDISPLGKGLVPGTQTEIRDFISARRDEIYATVYNDPEQDRKTIGKTTDAILKDELTQMGLFASNDREDADYGILTSDGQGGFPGWEAMQQSKIERTKGTNPQRTVRNLINEFTEYKNLNGVLENGKGITNAELLAVVESIQDGKLTTFPPDILLKSRILGIQPSTLITSKLDYLENTQDKGDKDFVKRFGLDPKKLKEYIPSTDIEMREVLEGINDGRTLLNQYNRLGIGGFTPNQLNRIIKANEDYNTRKRIANDALEALADK
tara:strand:- start:354 stop:2621 length:2268 start_codon:yes stop_codon:yes gene_type:complete